MVQIARNGAPRRAEIDRATIANEMEAAYAAARADGLWRFDARH